MDKITEDKLKDIVIYAYKEYDIKTLEFLVKLFTKRYESAIELNKMIKNIKYYI